MKRVLLLLLLLFCSVVYADHDDNRRERGKHGSRSHEVFFRGTPNGWGLTEMSYVGNGIYETTTYFSYDHDGNPRFKINTDRKWQKAYPDKDYRINSEGNYLIRFNIKTKEIFVSKIKSENKKMIKKVQPTDDYEDDNNVTEVEVIPTTNKQPVKSKSTLNFKVDITAD